MPDQSAASQKKYIELILAKTHFELIEKVNEKLQDHRWSVIDIDHRVGDFQAWLIFEDN